jgi:hypothetical protein
MKRISTAYLPMKRRKGLVIDDILDEVLVYDLDRDKAHCLNKTAALIWRHCDGKTRPQEIARRLKIELDASCNEDLVWVALRQLATLHLLEDSVSLPRRFAGMSRRQMIRNISVAAAVAVPVVTSIVAPRAAQAATCVPSGSPCQGNKLCCSPLGCNTAPNPDVCF